MAIRVVTIRITVRISIRIAVRVAIWIAGIARGLLGIWSAALWTVLLLRLLRLLARCIGAVSRLRWLTGIAILREGVIRELVIRKALTLNGGALGA